MTKRATSKSTSRKPNSKARLENSVTVKSKQVHIKPRNQAQQDYLDALENNEVVFGIGPAGTGKTFLGIIFAINKLILGEVDRVVVTRPAIESGEKLGFLPGDFNEKVDPYFAPIWESLIKTIGALQLRKLREEGKLEVAPLAYMRGRTLSNAVIVVDECQNMTVTSLRLVLSRLGDGSKMILAGDPEQSDLPNNTSGLVSVVKCLEKIDRIKVCVFDTHDVVRHPLIGKMLLAMKNI